jgi:hypothetical protein
MARSGREGFATCKVPFNVTAQLAGSTVALVYNIAQRFPGGVFEKDVIVAVKTVIIVDESAGFFAIRIFRRRNRLRDYLLNIHLPSRIVF